MARGSKNTKKKSPKFETTVVQVTLDGMTVLDVYGDCIYSMTNLRQSRAAAKDSDVKLRKLQSNLNVAIDYVTDIRYSTGATRDEAVTLELPADLIHHISKEQANTLSAHGATVRYVANYLT